MLPAVVPGVKFELQIQLNETLYEGEPNIGLREVKSGQTHDLGERKLKPQD